MTEIKLHSDYIKGGYTLVDNVFLSSYLPTADAIDSEVYLYGLYLLTSANSDEATIENVAAALKLTLERVREAFLYWEDLGLVSMSVDAPVRLTYLSVKNPLPRAAKFDVNKYSAFVEDAARLFPDRILTPNEIYAYEEMMHFSGLEPNALLMIMQYCKNIKDGKITAPYILAVANDWIKQGYLTEAKVNEHIDELESNSDIIRRILAALGVKSSTDLNARELYVKWCSWGFAEDAILTAAKLLKKHGGMSRLDKLLAELKASNAFSQQEIAEYAQNKEQLYATAEGVVKGIGAFYGSLDAVVDTYVKPWLNMGYSNDGLLMIAKLCFLSDIKSLDGVNDQIGRLYKLGVVTDEQLSDFVQNRMTIDANVKEVFELAGLARRVQQADRERFTIWSDTWGVSFKLICLAASMARGLNFATAKINNMLLAVKDNPNISEAEAEAIFLKVLKGEATSKPKKDMLTRENLGDDLPPIFDPNREV